MTDMPDLFDKARRHVPTPAQRALRQRLGSCVECGKYPAVRPSLLCARCETAPPADEDDAHSDRSGESALPQLSCGSQQKGESQGLADQAASGRPKTDHISSPRRETIAEVPFPRFPRGGVDWCQYKETVLAEFRMTEIARRGEFRRVQATNLRLLHDAAKELWTDLNMQMADCEREGG